MPKHVPRNRYQCIADLDMSLGQGLRGLVLSNDPHAHALRAAGHYPRNGFAGGLAFYALLESI